MTKNAKPAPAKSALAITLGALSGTIACGVLAILAYASGNDSFAKGIVQGGALGIAGMVTLLILARTRFATAESRVVSGAGDEREERAAVKAGAFAFVTMFVAAVVSTFAHSFGMEAEAGFAIIMFTGLISALASFAVQVRRG